MMFLILQGQLSVVERPLTAPNCHTNLANKFQLSAMLLLITQCQLGRRNGRWSVLAQLAVNGQLLTFALALVILQNLVKSSLRLY